MDVIKELGKALDNRDWKIVAKVFAFLDSQTPENVTTPVAIETQPEVEKKKRSRKKAVKKDDLVVAGNQVAKAIEAPSVDENFRVNVDRKPKVVDGQKVAARFEDFKPPTEPNKFDPNIRVDEDHPDFARINDKVSRTPRERGNVISHVKRFCNDCNMSVCVPPMSSLNLEIGRCEYAAVGKKQQCPYVSQHRG